MNTFTLNVTQIRLSLDALAHLIELINDSAESKYIKDFDSMDNFYANKILSMKHHVFRAKNTGELILSYKNTEKFTESLVGLNKLIDLFTPLSRIKSIKNYAGYSIDQIVAYADEQYAIETTIELGDGHHKLLKQAIEAKLVDLRANSYGIDADYHNERINAYKAILNKF